MIAIVDYGAGNLNSVKKAFDHLGAETIVTNSKEEILAADSIVLPGVGHFSALATLDANGLSGALVQQIRNGKPFLGICLGMQWLFEGSDESPQSAGARIFSGTCQQFPQAVKSPHVGWNSLALRGDSRLLQGVAAESFVYFTHSFRAPLVECTVALTEYGQPFSAVVESGNVFGVQFHPEKSGATGLIMLKNFCGLSQC
jgi:glutamine amidotransferase